MGVQNAMTERVRIVSRIPEITEEAKVLVAKGWTIPGYFSPREVSEFLSRSKVDPIDNIFVEYYEKDDARNYLELKERLWESSRLDFWRPLLLQALTTYEMRLYLVTVPALLSVIDGLVGNFDHDKWKADAIVRSQLAAASIDTLDLAIWASIDSFISLIFASAPFAPSPRLS
jgi:hypothetical protein